MSSDLSWDFANSDSVVRVLEYGPCTFSLAFKADTYTTCMCVAQFWILAWVWFDGLHKNIYTYRYTSHAFKIKLFMLHHMYYSLCVPRIYNVIYSIITSACGIQEKCVARFCQNQSITLIKLRIWIKQEMNSHVSRNIKFYLTTCLLWAVFPITETWCLEQRIDSTGN